MLHNLREIRLLNNEIQGTLPNNILESILSKSKLNTLELSNNSLTGSFPQSFTNLINLSKFSVFSFLRVSENKYKFIQNQMS